MDAYEQTCTHTHRTYISIPTTYRKSGCVHYIPVQITHKHECPVNACLQTHTRTLLMQACACVCKCVCVEFISGLIKLWRAVSVGRPQTEYAVNRLLIEREIRGLEERTVEERYEREEEEGDERGIIMSAEPHFHSVFDQRWEEPPPPRHTCSSKVELTGALRSVKIRRLRTCFCHCTR